MVITCKRDKCQAFASNSLRLETALLKQLLTLPNTSECHLLNAASKGVHISLILKYLFNIIREDNQNKIIKFRCGILPINLCCDIFKGQRHFPLFTFPSALTSKGRSLLHTTHLILKIFFLGNLKSLAHTFCLRIFL